ncbi:GCN5 family acetyltransferase [Lewinellaceae bacterium SD302]|nr:GCN5 family acetyltransferase [Lewinellaceae bacterium SD302]
MNYPKVKYPDKVGEYPALVKSGGGYLWDEVLEYRVWCHPELGAKDEFDGDDYFYSFETYEEAKKFSENNPGTESPLVLILQREYVDEPTENKFILVKEERLTEWKCEWLSRAKRSKSVVEEFFSEPTAERLYILRQ